MPVDVCVVGMALLGWVAWLVQQYALARLKAVPARAVPPVAIVPQPAAEDLLAQLVTEAATPNGASEERYAEVFEALRGQDPPGTYRNDQPGGSQAWVGA